MLAVLEKLAYVQYVTNAKEARRAILSYEEWISDRLRESVPFKYCYTVKILQLILLKFVRSLRTGDFPFYFEAVADVLPRCYIK